MPVHPPAPCPAARLRRLRRTAALRDLVSEHRLSPADLIWPVFVREGDGVEEPVASMPGVARLSLALRRTFDPAGILNPGLMG